MTNINGTTENDNNSGEEQLIHIKPTGASQMRMRHQTTEMCTMPCTAVPILKCCKRMVHSKTSVYYTFKRLQTLSQIAN